MASPLCTVVNSHNQHSSRNFEKDRQVNKKIKSNIESRIVFPIKRPGLNIQHPDSTANSSLSRLESITTPSIRLHAENGSLYKRRANKSPIKVPILPSPPLRACPILDAELSSGIDPRKFNVFNALLDYPELIVEMAKHLDIEDLISLYAISKDFHRLANSRFTSMIFAKARWSAPESSRIFIFRCYKAVCIEDPGARPNEEVSGKVRDVPGLPWLRMILHRESVVDGILKCLSDEGLFLPPRASLVLKKIWFTIDICDNKRRIGLVHNKEFWTDEDLYIATMFFIKLDMRLTDPLKGTGQVGLRKMFLAQRSLLTLLRVLKREEFHNQLDVLRMFIRWKYVPAPQYADQSILGVPPQKIGQLQYVGWGEKRQVLLQIDELVMREGVKRRLDLHESYLDMIIYGFIDPVTHEDRWHTEADAGDDGSDPDTETEYSDSDSERLDEADWEGNESGLDSDHEGGDGLGSKTEEDGSSSSTAQEQNPDDSEWEDMD